MKPIVIYLDKHDDEIKLTRKEFEEYINKAYDQGYACGYAEGKKYYPWWGNGGITYTQTNAPQEITYGTNTPTLEPGIKITCDNDRKFSFAPGNNITSSNLFIHGDDAVEKITNTNGTVFEAVSKALKELGEK